MKQQLKLTSLAVSLLGFLVSPVALAQSSTTNTSATSVQQQKAMLALAAKTELLEKELTALKQQIADLQTSQQKAQKTDEHSHMNHVQIAPPVANIQENTETQTTLTPAPYTASSPEASSAYPEVPLNIHAVQRQEDETGMQSRYYPTALTANGKILTYLAGVPVVTSPFLGQRPAFDGSDLIINNSKINQDIRLMKQRDAIEQQFVAEGYPAPDTPILMLSGTLQPLFTYQQPYSGAKTGNMTMDSAELDTTAIVNPWVEGLMTFVYSSAPPAEGGTITSNSNVSIDKAFVNIGNLQKTPFYLTAGQVYVPFGQYSSNMVSMPLTLPVGRVQTRAAMVGYAPTEDNGFFGTVFAFNSNTTLGNSGSGGANLVYQFGSEDINGNFGGSWISNIGDSVGMQNTGGSDGEFGGFGTSASTELVNQIPGYDFHGVFNVGAYSFLGEFVSAVRSFDASALSYEGQGAQPVALNAEAARTFKLFHKPATFALGYGWSDQALALMIPKQRMTATLNISWWRDTVESLEYRHDVDYSSSTYASGIGSTTNTTGTGSASDTISALLAVYF